METQKDCCQKDKSKNGLLRGLALGLLPHSFCIGFIIFSVVGATTFTVVFKNILLLPYFFQILVLISFIFATISAVIYLKSCDCLCRDGIKKKWKYIATLYSVTIITNLLMFFVVFPVVANLNLNNTANVNQLASLSMKVQIPCSGHAPLIIDEIKKDNGVGAVKFNMPNTFVVNYDPAKTSPEKILSLEIFKTFGALMQR